jgi:hypothetical protein
MAEHILKLAEIIREVDGSHNLGADALAEAILAHPGSRWQPAEESPDRLRSCPTHGQQPTEHQIRVWLDEDAAVDDPIFLADPDKPRDDFLAYPAEQVPAIILAALKRWGQQASVDPVLPRAIEVRRWIENSKHREEGGNPPEFDCGEFVFCIEHVADIVLDALKHWGQPPATPSADEMNDLADDMLGMVLPEGAGARLITRALELWGQQPAATPSAQEMDSLAEVLLGIGLPEAMVPGPSPDPRRQPVPPAPTRDELNDACGPGPTLEEVKAAAARLEAARLEDVEAKGQSMVDGLLQIEQRIQRLRNALREVIIACDGLATEEVSDEFLCKAPGEVRARLASVLRYGRPSVAPIPVSERLPGPDDCAPWKDQLGTDRWCWVLQRSNKFPTGFIFEWVQTSIDFQREDLYNQIHRDTYTTLCLHWAPYWAMPIPAQEDSCND